MNAVRLDTDSLDDGTRVLVVEGELDLDATSEFESALNAALAGSAPVVVDLTECSFLDSSALSVLVRAHNQLNGSGPLSLVIPESHVLKVFEMTHLEDVFEIRPTRSRIRHAR